jgi:hypothetical protein
LSSALVAEEKRAVVIKNATVFDSPSGRMLDGRTILIQGDTIHGIGTPQHPVAIPASAQILDGTGKFVIPGLIDAHVHLVHLSHFMHVTGDEFLPMFLAAGVTTVRSTGDPIVAQVGVAHYARAHPHLCPRVFTASPLIDRAPPIHRDVGYALTDPAKVPAFVDDMARWKVTTLKIYAGTPREIGKQIIENGHRHGLKVTAHLGAYTAQDAAADGIDCLEHIESVFDFCIPSNLTSQPNYRADLDLRNPKCQALVTLLARQKVAVDPTLVVFRNMLYLNDMKEYCEHPDVALCPARMREFWDQYSTKERPQAPETQMVRRRRIAKYQELTGVLHRLGVPILVGTDAPEPFVPPGFSLHQELAMLVESGLTPTAALQAATVNNARILGQEKNLGSIESGKLADLLILTADPTKEIKHTREIEVVIRGGLICQPKTVLKAVPRK